MDVITEDQIRDWDTDLRALTEQIAGQLFVRPEPQETFVDLVRGLLSDVPRKNSWQLADHVGHSSAHRLEWLLNGAKWDADQLRDAVADLVVGNLASPDAVLVIDDTQAIKKGLKSVGVAPQHRGATGQTENCQVMPMLTYASEHGHAFIDRELYLPQRWTQDPDRCREAGVPTDRGFLTKPRLATIMVQRALDADVPFKYLTGDSGYGRDPNLRAMCHRRAVPYVLAVPIDLPLVDPRGRPTRPDLVLAGLNTAAWERRSCGEGTKGARYYDWTTLAVTVKNQPPTAGLAHHPLVRRSVSDPTDIELFLAHAPQPTPITELIAVAGTRWKIEENNAQGKDLLGLDQYQVPKWTPWHRHVTTCMLAQAFLAVTRARLGKAPKPPERTAPGADPHR